MVLALQTGFDPVAAVASAGPVALATLLLLLVLSILTWATWGSRRVALGRLERSSRRARRAFLDASDTEAFAQACRRDLPQGPVPRMFAAAHEELSALLSPAGAFTTARAEAGRALLVRTLAGARAREVEQARRGLGLLATIGATAPFVGLFGTVWGVMRAFGEIGVAGSADLTVVAPGIAEALVATAAGLFAAVPAVWFYNALVGRVRRVAAELERFAIALLGVYDRAIASGALAARDDDPPARLREEPRAQAGAQAGAQRDVQRGGQDGPFSSEDLR